MEFNHISLIFHFEAFSIKPLAHSSLQHLVFTNNHPSMYWASSILLNFNDQNLERISRVRPQAAICRNSITWMMNMSILSESINKKKTSKKIYKNLLNALSNFNHILFTSDNFVEGKKKHSWKIQKNKRRNNQIKRRN